MSGKEIKLMLRVEGGVADEGVLDIYDAAGTIYGLARSVNMVAHSFVNDGEVKKKNKIAKGVKTVIHPSIKGCFEEQVGIEFEEKFVNSIGPSVFSNVFWDYLRWTWSGAIGIDWEPTTAYVKAFAKRKDVFIDEISDALEIPMQHLHKPIASDKGVKVFINRPKAGDVLEFDKETLDYVTIREESVETEYIVGNITRSNVLSVFGRLFSDEEGRVVSFSFADGDNRRVRDLALKSMQEHEKESKGKMHILVSKIMSAHGVVKRYIVHDILEIHNA
jgi:hypothetical protein